LVFKTVQGKNMTANKLIKLLIVVLLLVIPMVVALTVLAVTNPQVQTNSASSIQNTSATLNGNLYGLGGDYSATVWFQWGISSSYGYETNHTNQIYTGTFSRYISNLAPNTTFHFRAVAQNNYTTTYGQDMTFTTGQSNNNQSPVANAGPNQYVNSGQSVTLQGSGYDPSGGYVNFYWTCTGGTLSNYNIAQPVYTAPYNNYNNQITYTCTLTVTNNQNYSNSSSTTIYVNYNNNGNNNLSVQTNQATNTFNNQATLNGYLSNANYSNYGTTYVWFEWGTSASYGYSSNHLPQQYAGLFSQNIAGLTLNTIYHFRAVAQNNNGGLVYGQDMTFNSDGGQYNYNYVNYVPQQSNYVPVILTTATGVSTGIGSDFTDSFFPPLLVLIVGIWAINSRILGLRQKLAKVMAKRRARRSEA